MRYWALSGLLFVSSVAAGADADDMDPMLGRIRERMKIHLARVPDYLCQETVERAARTSPGGEFKVRDTLRLEVGTVGDKEMFAWRDAARFSEKELADMVGSGTIGNGSFVLHARHVLGSHAPEFAPRGEERLDGRRTIRYDYEVPRERSGYRIRVHPRQAIVGFRGSFWVDADTLDLIRLEVIADDVPEELGVAQAREVMDYAQVGIGDSSFLLPRASELWMAGTTGDESRNRTRFHDCRQYSARSSVSFDEPSPPAKGAATGRLAPRTALELALESEIDLEKVALGDPVLAAVRQMSQGGRAAVPAGSLARGRIVRLDRETMPVPHYVVAIEMDALELGGATAPLLATMLEAGPAAGLLRQEKRFMPTFTQKRPAKLGILVAEQQRGQGVLLWDAKRPRIPRGLRMRWETGATAETAQEK